MHLSSRWFVKEAIAVSAIFIACVLPLPAQESDTASLPGPAPLVRVRALNEDGQSIEQLVKTLKETRDAKSRLDAAEKALAETLRKKTAELEKELRELGLATPTQSPAIGSWQAPIGEGPRWTAPIVAPVAAAPSPPLATPARPATAAESGRAYLVRNVIGVQGPMVQIVFAGATIEAKHLLIKLKDKTLDLTAGKEAMTVIEVPTEIIPTTSWQPPRRPADADPRSPTTP